LELWLHPAPGLLRFVTEDWVEMWSGGGHVGWNVEGTSAPL
jgi:hypothetical protein